jgi:D-glutamate N-acetyltransferase
VSPPRFLILAEGAFGPETSKTANSAIRYIPAQVAGVLDGTAAGRTAQEVLGFGGPIPVVGTLEEGLRLRPTALLIGIAPRGGRLPVAWRGWIATAIERGLDVWSGLHSRLADDPDLAARARARGVRLQELRVPPPDLPVSNGRARDVDALVVLTVGSDCNTGKMTAQLEILRALEARGVRTRFVPTGQTGILIAGAGIAVDAVVADFIGGAAEQLVLAAAPGADVVLVEGQGSLVHPGYSGVTLGLLHGTCPAAMILCHNASRHLIGEYHPGEAWRAIPPLAQLVRVYEEAAAWVHPSKVIGVALNTHDLPPDAAAAAVEHAAHETGLPAVDPVRFGAAPLVEAIVRAAADRRAARRRASA